MLLGVDLSMKQEYRKGGVRRKKGEVETEETKGSFKRELNYVSAS